MKIEPSDILLLQETKIDGQALKDISKSKWKKNEGIAVSSRGTSGGVATLWSKDLFHLSNYHETQHWIFMELKHLESKLTIALFNLYVPVNYVEKRDCWNTLSAFLDQQSLNNIVLGGDLNLVMKPKEKRGGNNNRDQTLPLVEEIMQQWDLLDFAPARGKYTWTNNRTRSDHIAARLDRFLIQTSLLMENLLISTKNLPKLSSDHKPIQLLLAPEEDLGPIPFKFNPLWIEKEGFMDTIQSAWDIPINGSPSCVWEKKLKATKKSLKEWLRKLHNPTTQQRKTDVQQLETLQIGMEGLYITPEILNKEATFQRNIHQSIRREEEHWRLKSRSLWLKAGDRNTSFFHRQYKARLSRNHITEIKNDEGKICNKFDQIKIAAENHYKELYGTRLEGSKEDTEDLLSHIPHLITHEDNQALLKPVSEEEIIKVIWAMDLDKAPGLDGFTIHFFKICWDIIKTYLLKMIHGFFGKAKIGGGTNSTFLALIPKEANPETFDRFRPISLCNASYKILSKIMANRIKPLLDKLISKAQGGFVKGRHILDNIIQVQEAIHSRKQRKEKGMLIKLDMANTFDRVNHSFLLQVLRSFGFPPQFINLIKACISCPWIAPMVNGRPASFFQAHRGLRQGCPLSPFLYILMVDYLSRKLTAEMNTGDLPGIRITNALNPINHALFADDSTLIGGASTRIAVNFDSVLKIYCRASGAVINDRKSSIFGWNVSQHNLNNIAQILGFECFAQWDSIKYLGLPLTSGVNNRSLWQDPTHQINETFIAKYAQGISLRHLSASNTTAGTYTWNLCRKSISSFSKHLYRIPGNGEKTLLWKDRIMNNPPLSFHAEIWDIRKWLHDAGIRKLNDISEWDSRGNWVEWAIPPVPAQLQHQTEILKSLLLNAAPVHHNIADRWGWGETGFYTPSLGYSALQTKKDSIRTPSFWKQVWNAKGLPEVNFFFWILMQNKQLTGDNLSKRNFLGPHRCAMCKNSGETAPHLFIDCVYAKEVWTLTLLGLPASLPQHSSIADLFSEWPKYYPHSIPKKSLWHLIWLSIPKFVCWEIWLARNDLIFNNSSRSPAKSASIAKGLLVESVLQHSQTSDSSLLPSEKAWLNLHSPHPSSNVRSLPPPLPSPPWKIRESELAFQNWWKIQNVTSIFFDGASKGNPGAAGAGGVIYFADNLRKVHFCWGLDISTNNQAELLALTKACQIARDKGIKECQVFGDSEILIRKINSDAQFNNAILNKSLNRLKLILQDFTSFKIYHILRSLNKEADEMANKGCLLAPGTLNYNGNNANSIFIP
eukprot:PITA_25214